ncbi:MAG: cytochrome b/b6 domain-containing protein [Acidobacteriaceae bacterium]
MQTKGKICAWFLSIFLLTWACGTLVAQKPKDSDCLACHSDPTLTQDVNGKKVSLYVDPTKMKGSIHGAMFSCVDCHKDVTQSPHTTEPKKITCAGCHADAEKAYLNSNHAKDKRADGTPAATCVDCHGDAHDILPASDPKSPVNHANIPATCGRCHGQKFAMESSGVSTQIVVSYQESVHGRAVKGGSQSAAVCTDCHGTHAILPANDAGSPINKFNVAATCGKCHGTIEQTFLQSVHGQALGRGNQLSPTCTDCHGIHTIKAVINSNSPVAQNLAGANCVRCHQGVRLTDEFGVPGNRVSSYLDSYHGLAYQNGSVVVANCASCHGVHNILPSSDPRSTINPANLDATCGQCHKGATRRFVLGKVHLDPAQPSSIGGVVVRFVSRFYIALILLVIGGMFLHNAIIWRSKAIARRKGQHRTVLRLTRNQRWQHFILMFTFTVLVITGFALKYPDSWFAAIFGMGEKVRSIVHRAAGVVLIVLCIYHIVYAAVTRDGRKWVRHMAPGPKDAFDAWGTMRYYLGLSKEKPKFGHFNYAEKAEYWAMVWGTTLMAVTGIMLWARVSVGNLLARWCLDVATAIHFYEAILAALAIVVWHFYQVLFDPDTYPVEWAFWDGKMDAEHYREEHELDTESLAEAAAAEPVKNAGDKSEKKDANSPGDSAR